MKLFEIHITGDEGIIDALNEMGIKNIVVDLLKPNGEILRTEYMSSYVLKVKSFLECLTAVNAVVKSLSSQIRIVRVKIESPVYDEYIDTSLYIETHYLPDNQTFPLSRNVRSGKIIATDRSYVKKKL